MLHKIKLMLQRGILTIALFITGLTAFGQVGTIKGSVKDATTNDVVVGANVFILGTTQGSAADIEGNFEIKNVKVGTYSLVISFVSYRTDTLKNIVVYPDQTTVIHAKLVEESQQLSEVVVRGAKVTNTDFAVITELKKNDLVAVGISAQQISLSQDRDAAQIIRRLPGITITNNKFINVRGLTERYSTVLLDGVITPSTEVDSRAFSFDLIPSNMIDRIMVYKSGSADLPADFAGAVVNISTKNVVDENAVSVGFTAGFRAGTTFEDFYTTQGSSTDWLGFGNSYRELSSSFPSRNLRNYSADLSSYQNRKIVTDAGLSLKNNWKTTQTTAAPDLRTVINFSRIAHLGKYRLSNVSSLNYSNTRQLINQENNFYESSQGEINPGIRNDFQDTRSISTVRLGVISNFVFELSPSHKLEFRNLFNQQGNDAVTQRSGQEVVNNYDVKNLSINYIQRALYSGQLAGRHAFNDALTLNWNLAYSSMAADQPDYRRIRSQRTIGSSDPYSVVISPTANSNDGRFFSNLTEKVYTHSASVDYKLNPGVEENRQTKLSFGYYVASTQRDFKARWFSFVTFPSQNPGAELLQRPFDQIFTPENISNSADSPSNFAPPTFFLDEGTAGNDKYTGDNLYTSGFANISIPFGAFKVVAGTRLEYNKQQLNSADDKGPVNVNNPKTSLLPFVNTSYNFTDKSLVRLSYSKTLNRPIFREIAPFNYYDFDRNANFIGNPDLKVADIHNVDLRWELYPASAEMITVGGFYKHFINPIETRLLNGSNIIYSYINAKSATVYGVEVELKKSLSTLGNSKLLDNLMFQFNGSLIKSKISLPEEAENQERNRAMQGQSPYVLNAGLYYSDVDAGFQVNVSYNVFGKRIFAIGDVNSQTGKINNANQYEMPRQQLDMTITKDFGKHFEVKIGVQDILNQAYHLVQDTNNDRSITSVDDTILRFRQGQYFSAGFLYKL